MVKSIVTDDMEHCFICGTTANIQIHHVYPGTANRKQSDKYGLVIPLCLAHHTGSKNSAHHNIEIANKVKQIAQQKFEEKYSHEEFMKIIGKNYL